MHLPSEASQIPPLKHWHIPLQRPRLVEYVPDGQACITKLTQALRTAVVDSHLYIPLLNASAELKIISLPLFWILIELDDDTS